MPCNVLRSRLSARVAGLRDKARKARYAPRPRFGKLPRNRGNPGQPWVIPGSMCDMMAKYKGRSVTCSLCDRDLTRALGGEHLFCEERFIPIGPIWSAGPASPEFATAGNCHQGTCKLTANAARHMYRWDKAIAWPRPRGRSVKRDIIRCA
jgi:hypothetical protein